jgi:chemotaxis protein CheX
MPTETASQLTRILVIAFVNSVKNVLGTMAGTEVTLKEPRIKTDNPCLYDVSGIVGFSGEVTGSVVVNFRQGTAARIVEAFTGQKPDVDGEDFPDAVGELCNMIAGNAKKDFGLRASISIPTVVIGTDHAIARLRTVPCISIPCNCQAGEFEVNISIKETASKAK